jgi:predicted metal-binding membrane protein
VSVLAPTGPAQPRRIPLAVPAAICLAWAVAVVTEASGSASAVHHDGLIGGGPPRWVALVLFLGSWQLMTAAMMLPSSMPLVRLFWAASRRRGALAAFLGGYALVWSLFGLLAFTGDNLVHALVDALPPLQQRPWLISGGVLVTAGAFQFTRLKDACLNECRHPAVFLTRGYRRGTGAAFRLGRDHGIFCLGCCWALMLVMFAAGFANLAWMAVLAAVTAYEKAGRHGRALTPALGAGLAAWGALVLLHPAWLPAALGGL